MGFISLPIMKSATYRSDLETDELEFSFDLLPRPNKDKL